jgi:TRAP-type mannitol/chloroaromatic compound transport system permease small subunit
MTRRTGEQMDRLVVWFDRVSLLGVWGGGILLFASIGLIAFEIVLRKGFETSLQGTHELSTYAFAICVSWGFAYALFRKAHIRIDVVYVLLSPAYHLAFDGLALLALSVFTVMGSWQAFDVLATSISRGSISNTPLGTPLWIPQLLWFIGFLWFTVCVVLLLLRTVVAAVERDTTLSARLVGSPTLDEEIELETEIGAETGTGTGTGNT